MNEKEKDQVFLSSQIFIIEIIITYLDRRGTKRKERKEKNGRKQDTYKKMLIHDAYRGKRVEVESFHPP